jgi:hypothetical protein
MGGSCVSGAGSLDGEGSTNGALGVETTSASLVAVAVLFWL